MSSQTPKISLRDLQSWMRWIITDPRGVSDALANPKPSIESYAERYRSPEPSALATISSSAQLPADARLSIYAEAYFLRILEALETDFKRLRLVMGEEDFQQVVAEYLKAYPSTTFNIGEVGRKLPQFLSENDFDPVFKAVAEFELNILETFYAESRASVEAHAFAELTDEQWEHLVIELNPSAKILTSNWSLNDFWNLETEKSTSDFKTSKQDMSFLIWQNNFQVRFIEISQTEADALKLIQSGMGFSTALDNVVEDPSRTQSKDEISQEVMAAFSRWIQNGLISGIKI
jgi:hypothetical protein